MKTLGWWAGWLVAVVLMVGAVGCAGEVHPTYRHGEESESAPCEPPKPSPAQCSMVIVSRSPVPAAGETAVLDAVCPPGTLAHEEWCGEDGPQPDKKTGYYTSTKLDNGIACEVTAAVGGEALAVVSCCPVNAD